MSPIVTPPLTAIDVETMVLGFQAVLFAALWLRDREPGMPWVAFGFALVALWYGNSERLHYTSPNMDTPLIRQWGMLLGVSIVFVNLGVVKYLGWPAAGPMRVFVIACGVPALALVLALALGMDVPRRLFQIGALLCYVGAATLAFRRHPQEPGAGHILLGIVLLSLPLTPVVLLVAGVQAVMVRYFAAVPVILFGLILLTVSLLRRRHALEAEVERRTLAEHALRETNARLEHRVRERTAHLQELVAGLEMFNRSVSHDLRGPLSGIAGLARMAEQSLGQGNDELVRRALPAIAAQAESSTQLVSTLLELARLGNAPLKRRPVALEEFVHGAFDEAMLGQQRKGEHEIELSCGEMPQALIDADLLRPALVNLIANAAKFSRATPKPRIHIEASTAGDDIVVSVRDNGVGFDAEAQQRMFQPFHRFHGDRFEGHGLGLSIVRRAVERHGGSVRATSTPGGGATFSFTVPGAVLPGTPAVVGV